MVPRALSSSEPESELELELSGTCPPLLFLPSPTWDSGPLISRLFVIGGEEVGGWSSLKKGFLAWAKAWPCELDTTSESDSDSTWVAASGSGSEDELLNMSGDVRGELRIMDLYPESRSRPAGAGIGFRQSLWSSLFWSLGILFGGGD